MQVNDGFFIQFLRLAGPYWNSKNKIAIRRDTAFIIVLTVMQIYIAVVITQWNAALFDALEQRSMSGLVNQFGMLVLIFIANIAVTTKHLIVKRRLVVGWRMWLTDKVVSKWMHKGRHYQMTILSKTNHDNPDGRIAEDIRIATEEAVALVHSFFYSLLLLGSFTAILWTLSGTIEIDLGLVSFSLSGYLVWIAIAYSISASILGWWMGKPLTKATHERQTEEANYRHALILVHQNAKAIASNRSEDSELEKLFGSFKGIILTYQQQTAAWKQIQIFTSGYSMVSMALPILTVAPRYILGSITLGTLMQSIQAFEQMVSSLSWPVNNLAQIAKWRTSVERVLGLVNAMDELDHAPARKQDEVLDIGQPMIPALAVSLMPDNVFAIHAKPGLNQNINDAPRLARKERKSTLNQGGGVADKITYVDFRTLSAVLNVNNQDDKANKPINSAKIHANSKQKQSNWVIRPQKLGKLKLKATNIQPYSSLSAMPYLSTGPPLDLEETLIIVT